MSDDALTSLARADGRADALDALRALVEAERATASSDAVDDDAVFSVVTTRARACEGVLTRGVGTWYETLRERDRRALVDAWFDVRGEMIQGKASSSGAALTGTFRTVSAIARRDGGGRDVAKAYAVESLATAVARGAIEGVMAFEEDARRRGWTRTRRAASETVEAMIGAFERLDARTFEIPMFRTTTSYEEECARRVLAGGTEAPGSAAAAACRMCRRGGAGALARATLRAFVPCVRSLSVDEVRSIVDADDIPVTLRWGTTMMNEMGDAHAATRWIAHLFAACDGRQGEDSCTWRTLDVILRVLLRDRYWSCEAMRFHLSETLLLRKGVPRNALPALLRLTILRPIKRGCDASRVKTACTQNILALLETWSSEDFVRGGSVGAQRHLTWSAALLLAATPSDEWNAMRGNPTQLILKGVSTRLDAVAPRARRHASLIAHELSLKMDASNPLRLLDGDDAQSSDDESEWMRDMTRIVHNDVIVEEESGDGDATDEQFLGVDVPAKVEIKSIDPDEVVDMWSVRRDDSDESDLSDNDEDDDLIPYDMDSDDEPSLRSGDPASLTERRIASLPKPQTLRECVDALRHAKTGTSTQQTDIDLADRAEGAVHAVSDLVAKEPHELASCAADLAVAILHAHPPTPDSDPLDRARRQGLASLFTVTPGLAGPPTIEHALSESCDASQVVDTLSAIEVAAANLATPRTTELLDDASNAPVRDRLGVERRFAPKSLEARGKSRSSASTRSHLIGDSFVAPLLRSAALRLERQVTSGRVLDGLDAMVCGQILQTIGQCARHARNAVDAPLIGRAVLEFALAPPLAQADHPHLRRSVLIAGGLVASSLPEVALGISYAEASDLARALERFAEHATSRSRSDVDADVRASAAFALDACARARVAALDAIENLPERDSTREITLNVPKRSIGL